MNRTDISRLGGKVTSKKKAKSCRKNARKPRPGRSEFNRAVRECAARYRGNGIPDSNAQMVATEIAHIRTVYDCDEERAGKIFNTAIKRT